MSTTNHYEAAEAILDWLTNGGAEDDADMATVNAQIATGYALLAIHDLLNERPPKPTTVHCEIDARNLEAFKHEASRPMREHGDCCEADDLPGEPVEPGDLRAGDKVAFTWKGERITCTLVSSPGGLALLSDVPDSNGHAPDVVWRGGVWVGGISDVRLIERAPREDEDPDEALAKVLCSAFWGEQVMPSFDDADWTNVARAAREHMQDDLPNYSLYVAERERAEKAEAERDEWEAAHRRVDGAYSRARNERDIALAKFEQADNLLSRTRDERDHFRDACDSWQSAAQEAEYLSEKFRAERDEAVKRHAALREDVDRVYRRTDYPPAHIALKDILDRDDERAKGGQR